MKYIYLINRFHFGKKTDGLIRKLEKVSKAMGRDFEVDVCETMAEAEAVRDKYKDTEYVITAIGGDGTINHLVNALAGTRNILSFIPSGTGNDFYRTCLESLDDGIHRIDLVRVNDRYFINTICFGIDADIANDERFIHNFLIPKPLRFHAAAFFHFLGNRKGRRMKICWEGGAANKESEMAEKKSGTAEKESAMTEGNSGTAGAADRSAEKNSGAVKKECVTVVAANGRYYGGGYKVSPGSRLDDGQMELYIVDQVDRIRMARIILSMKNAGHLQNPALQKIEAKKALIRAPRPFYANIDGEPIYSDRFELEVIPGGIRLLFDRGFLDRLRACRF